MVKTSSAVRMASMKTPRTMLVSGLSVVRTLKPVGNMTLTRKLEKMLPANCATSSSVARTGLTARHSNMAKVTAGLNSPPLIRKKIHTLTMSEKPKTTAM
jgi:hypothetical protein